MPHRIRSVLLAAGAGLVMAAAAAPARAQSLVTRPVGSVPLSDAQAAARVQRSAWEPRPENRVANHRVPSAAEIAGFRARSEMPNRRWVTGNLRGTTDEVIQWAAHKWGFHPDLLRAVATVESWWRMSAVGDGGDSFGLFQMRRPYHCCLPLMSGASAFNADYYGGILRAYYDGKQGWLNTVERGRDYRAGDLWGSVGAWFSARWHWGGADAYAARVRQHLRDRTWRAPAF
jgi:hypothetical protein